jgi:hypothetical protein
MILKVEEILGEHRIIKSIELGKDESLLPEAIREFFIGIYEIHEEIKSESEDEKYNKMRRKNRSL